MNTSRDPNDGAEPRQSITAFLEAARREGLLSDSQVEALTAFHRRPAGSAAPPSSAAPEPGAAAEPSTLPAITSLEREKARALLRALRERLDGAPSVLARELSAVTARLEMAMTSERPQELRPAMFEARKLIERIPPSPPSPAPASGPESPTRRIAADILAKLEDRRLRASGGEHTRVAVATNALTRALEGPSDSAVATALGRAMGVLGIQPAPPQKTAVTPPHPTPQTPGPAPPPARPAAASRTAATPAPKPATPARPETPATGPGPRPQPARPPARTGPSLLERSAVAVKASAVRFGTRITADVAANALTYIGVLLALVVVYVFFAMGTFGEVVDDPRWRPLFIVGTVFFFLGLAQVLRRGTGIPATATAIEVIGVIFVPIMAAALIRDGCTPSHAFWCLSDFSGPHNPDNPGLWRWLVYGGVGMFSAGVYYLFAKRRRLYAYMVVPVTWIAVGALGLYAEDGLAIAFGDDPASVRTFVHDGISAWQFVAVLGAIAATMPLARRYRTSPIGKVVAVPAVRAGVVLAPLVVAVGFLVAYFNDTLQGARPGLEDMAGPSITLFLSAAVVFATSSRAGFAFAQLPEKTRDQSATVLQAAAYVSVAAAWVLSAAYDLAPGWIGVGLVGYSVVVAFADHITDTTGRSAAWIARLSGAAGLSLTLVAPLPALIGWSLPAAAAILAGRFPTIDAVWSSLVPSPVSAVARRLRLWVPLFVVVGAGAARLVWPDGTAWVLAAAAAAFAAARAARGSPDVVSLARFPAVATGLAAVGIQSVLQARGDAMGGYEFGALLLFLALVAGAVDAPWAVRLPAVTGLLAAGSSVLLREAVVSTALDAAWVDTAALAAFGLALLGGMLIGEAGKATLVQASLGHAFVLAALGRSLAFEQTALLGLGAVAVAYAAEALAIETGRPGLFVRWAAGAGEAAEAVRALPTLVVTAVMIPIALLAGNHVPYIREERARLGPVLSAVSWVYVAGAWTRRARTRRIVVPFAFATAAAGIAVSIPSTTAILITTWSAAAATAAVALAVSRPYTTTVSWGLTVAATVTTAVRLGVDRGDAHLVLHAVSVALLIGPALINARGGRPAGLTSSWLRPPVAVAMLLIPASLAIAISDTRYLAVVAFSAAAAYGVLGWSTRTGGVSIPVAFTVAVGYAHLLNVNGWAHPFNEPLVWVPLAALYVGATWVLPDRRSWRFLEDASPGLFTAGLSLGGLALILSFEAAVTDAVLAALAGVLFLAYLVRAHDAWLVAAVVALASSGFIAGDHWPPVVAATAAVAAGVRSDHYADRPVGTVLSWISAAWWAVTFALVAIWRDWSPAELTGAAALAGGVLVSGGVWLSSVDDAPARARRWAPPMHVLGQLAVATVVAVAVSEFAATDAYGTVAGVAAAEAALTGVLGTARRDRRLAAAAGVLAAVAYGFFVAWRDWSTPEFISITSAIGGALLALWVAVRLGGPRSTRLRLWLPVAFATAEAAGAAVVAASWVDLDAIAAAGITGAVLGSQAVLAGLMGTVLRTRRLVATSAALAASAYGFTVRWAQWDPPFFVAVTAAIAGALTLAFVIGTLATAVPDRVRLWPAPLGIAGQAAAVAAVAAAWTGLDSHAASGVTAAILGAEALLTGGLGAIRRRPAGIWAAAALTGGAYGFMSVWLEWDPATLVLVTATAGATLATASAVGMLKAVASPRRSLWLHPAAALAQSAAIAVVAQSWSALSDAGASGVTAAVAIAEAVLVGAFADARRNRYLAAAATMLVGAGYGFTAGWLQWDVETFVAVTWPLGAALVMLTTYAYLRGAAGPRLGIWLPPAAATGHVALVAAISVGISGLSARDASGVVAAAAAFESIVFGIVGGTQRRSTTVAASTVLLGTAYGFALHAAEIEGAGLVAWIGAAAAGAGGAATWATRTSSAASGTRLWVGPMHDLAAVGAGATVVTASAVLPDGTALWVAAVVFFFSGTHLVFNAGHAPDALRLPVLSALAYVSSAGLATAWSIETASARGAIVFGIAVAGLIAAAAWSAPVLGDRWRLPVATAAVGFAAVALVGSPTAFGLDGPEFASTLLVVGAALGVHGLLERRLRALEAAVVVWLVAGLILLDERVTLTLHAAVVLVAAALLVVLEIERRRRAEEDLPVPDAMNRTEWALMIAPMALAAFDMPDRLWYGLVLFAEGLTLTAWGAASRVLRRAFVGFGGVVLAVLLSVAIPIIDSVRRGLTTNTWLVIAAAAAVVFITIGSTIERRRVAIGARLRRIGEIVEDWE